MGAEHNTDNGDNDGNEKIYAEDDDGNSDYAFINDDDDFGDNDDSMAIIFV
jgi:hypothetical protein